MYHSFDTAHAKQYGLPEAVVIYNLQFWIVRNRANGEHLHDGRTWSYNSVRAFEKVFDYLSPKQIRGALERLVDKGVLVTGRYSEDARDRTNWYGFADESRFLDGVNPHLPPKANAPDDSGDSDLPEGANARAGRGKSLIRADVNADKNPDAARSTRGTRLADDWKLPRKWGVWALGDEDVNRSGQWSEEHVRAVAKRFHDHWRAAPGRSGVKRDWEATWRNWCRDERSALPTARRGGGGSWRASEDAALAKANEVGVGGARSGESKDAWFARIDAAIENGGKPPAARPMPVTPLDPVPASGQTAERGTDVSRAAASAAKALLRGKAAGGLAQ